MLKNITLSADENLIRKAREKARKQNKSLNVMFRAWLKSLVDQENVYSNYDELMLRLNHINSGRKFSREELNER